MKGLPRAFMLLGLGVLAAGCSAAEAPVAPPPPPHLEFTILAPAEIDTKKLIEIVVRIDRAQSLVFPLQVSMEKANVGQEFFPVGELAFQDDEQGMVTFRVPIAMDPTLRVTVAEPLAGGISITRTVTIDVLDFVRSQESQEEPRLE